MHTMLPQKSIPDLKTLPFLLLFLFVIPAVSFGQQEDIGKEKNRWLASGFSFLVPGTGHVYAEKEDLSCKPLIQLDPAADNLICSH